MSTVRSWSIVVALVLVGFCAALLFMCASSWFIGDPFETVEGVSWFEEVESDTSLQHHALGRDELIFRRESNLEVYRIDEKLTRLRVVPIDPEVSEFHTYLAPFPNSPLVILYDPSEAGNASIVSTKTGEVERQIPYDGDLTFVLVSPDEHWLALGLRTLTVFDLRTGDKFELPGPHGERPSRYGGAFLGPNTFFVPGQSFGYQLWDLQTRRVKWSGQTDIDHTPLATAGNESRIVVGSRASCQLWNAETGEVIHSHWGNRGAWAVAMHPKTGDYLAGYHMQSFSPHSKLDGAVRIWNADGVRFNTFPAHGDGIVYWMAFSSSGKYLVTAGDDRVRVWDYDALTKR